MDKNDCLKIMTFSMPRPPPTRRGRLEQAIRRLRRRLWGSAVKFFFTTPFSTFLRVFAERKSPKRRKRGRKKNSGGAPQTPAEPADCLF